MMIMVQTKFLGIVQHLVNITNGGADYTFDATGNVEVMRAALESAPKVGVKV